MWDVGLSEQVFSNSLIMPEILKNLERKDLLRTSLVNKSWKMFSRKILKENKKWVARVETANKDACHNLSKLNALLLNTEHAPFNGISISVAYIPSDHKCIKAEDLFKIMSNILAIINLKYLDLNFLSGYSITSSNCVVLGCIRDILEKVRSLEALRVYVTYNLLDWTFSQLIGLGRPGQSLCLPNVRILEIQPNYMIGTVVPGREYIKELVEAAINLQELHGYIEAQDLEWILPLEASRAVKDFVFRPTVASLEDCEALALENPQLRKLLFSISHSSKDESSFRKWVKPLQNQVRRILEQLLQSSEDSLNKFACKHPDLILITSEWNIPVLKNVTQLWLGYCKRMKKNEGQGCNTLRKIEWAKYFPNLKEVIATDVWDDSYNIEDNIYIGESGRDSNAQFVCKTVTKLSWMWPGDFAGAAIIRMFAKIFPNVKEFCIPRDEETTGVVPYLNELWTAWANLETLCVQIKLESLSCNYDSVFLGISEEEAVYLRKNVKNLGSLETVSIKPCIFNLRKLKKLVIDLPHNNSRICEENSSETFLLSRLAGQCVFSRIPGLTVEIYGELCNARRFRWNGWRNNCGVVIYISDGTSTLPKVEVEEKVE